MLATGDFEIEALSISTKSLKAQDWLSNRYGQKTGANKVATIEPIHAN